MPELIDLDAVLPEDVGVQLDGTVYHLPGDIKGEELVRLLQLGQRSSALIEKAANLTAADQKELAKVGDEFEKRFEDLFRIRQDIPDDFISGMARSQVDALVQRVFAYYLDIPIPEGGDRPTQTKPKRRNSRRSPRRSNGTAPKASASSTSSQT